MINIETLKVSVIIPNYNCADYIERAIRSVRNQTYHNVEIVIVDDDSVDNSYEVCMGICSSDPDIKFLKREKNGGQLAARTDGLNLSTGDWVIFLDADDYLNEDSIESFIKIALNTDVDLVFAGYETINSEGTQKIHTASINEGLYSSNQIGKYLFNEIPMNVLSCVGPKLYKASFLKNRKDHTNPIIRSNSDLAFIIDSLLSCDHVYYLNKVCYTYCLRSGSITYSYRENMYNAICSARRRIKEYLIKCNCYENKKIEYGKYHYELIRCSLGQEIRYKKGYKSFRKAFYEISLDEKTKEAIDIILNSKVETKYKIVMRLIKRNHPFALYLISIFSERFL